MIIFLILKLQFFYNTVKSVHILLCKNNENYKRAEDKVKSWVFPPGSKDEVFSPES